jgi:hypothetical protein
MVLMTTLARVTLLALLIAVAVAGNLCAQPEEMTFFAQPPIPPKEMFGSAWRIFAEGPIDPGAPTRFKRIIADHHIPPLSVVYLDSPGGNLLASMELGRLIRKNGYFTEVHKKGPASKGGLLQEKLGVTTYEPLPGICASACTLSFIGGVFRWLDQKSVYGVHRFYGNSSFDADIAQVTSSAVVQYIREMGVDPELFDEMTKAGREEINILPLARLVALGAVNNGVEKARWSIESGGDFVYLKGERNTQYGFNKFMVVCSNRVLWLYVMFDPQGRGDEILTMGSQSLLIDGNPIPIAQLRTQPQRLEKGWLHADYRLTPELVQKLRMAKTVGIAFQFAPGAPMFLGFNGMELEEGRSKLNGLIATCGW